MIGFSGCQKETEIKPEPSLEAKSSKTKITPSIGLFMDDIATVGGEAMFWANVFETGEYTSLNCGKFTLQKWNPKSATWFDVKGAQNIDFSYPLYTISPVKLSDAGIYRWHYISSGNCNFNSTFSGSLELIVI